MFLVHIFFSFLKLRAFLLSSVIKKPPLRLYESKIDLFIDSKKLSSKDKGCLFLLGWTGGGLCHVFYHYEYIYI